MNTETLNALKQVNLQIQTLQQLLSDPKLKPEEEEPMEEALVTLESMQDTLIHQALQQMIDQLNASNAKLQDVVERMQKVNAKLAKLATTIKKVSEIVGTLVTITAKAMSAGLLG